MCTVRPFHSMSHGSPTFTDSSRVIVVGLWLLVGPRVDLEIAYRARAETPSDPARPWIRRQLGWEMPCPPHDKTFSARVPSRNYMSSSMEYAKDGIRVNAVAPGIVDTPLQKGSPKDFLKTLQPLEEFRGERHRRRSCLFEEAEQVTGEVLHVDGGAHVGKW